MILAKEHFPLALKVIEENILTIHEVISQLKTNQDKINARGEKIKLAEQELVAMKGK